MVKNVNMLQKWLKGKGYSRKKVSPGDRTPLKFRGTTNRFKLKKHTPTNYFTFWVTPHQQI